MTNITRKITDPQAKALDWLNRQGGTGVFTKDGRHLIAKGIESAFTRSTWVALRDAQRVTIDGNRVTSMAPREAQPIERNPSEHSSSVLGGRQVNAHSGAE